MTDRERQMIEAYLPHPRDPELGFNEYYVLDARDRPTKVRIISIGCKRDQDIYQVMTDKGRLIHGPWESETGLFGGGWYTMSNLYDNREDCRDNTHVGWEWWERLREIQQREAN